MPQAKETLILSSQKHKNYGTKQITHFGRYRLRVYTGFKIMNQNPARIK